jgi:ribosomal protein S18 acetylase RimI-like enzyme
MTSAAFSIREVREKDRGDLVSLFREHFRWGDDGFIQAHLDSCMEPETCVFIFGKSVATDWLSHDNHRKHQSRMFVAVTDGKIAAFGHAGLQPDNIGYICDLYTSPEHRKKGMCTALINACEDWFSAQGMKASSMSVYEENQNARNLYEHCGYADSFNSAAAGSRQDMTRIPKPYHLLMVKRLG